MNVAMVATNRKSEIAGLVVDALMKSKRVVV
jgi:hypothetical protein